MPGLEHLKLKRGLFVNFRRVLVLFGIAGSLLAVQFSHRTQRSLLISLASVQYSMSWSSPNWRSSSSPWQNEDEGADSRIFRNTEDDDDVEEPPPLLAQSSNSALRNNSLASSTGSILADIPTDAADSVIIQLQRFNYLIAIKELFKCKFISFRIQTADSRFESTLRHKIKCIICQIPLRSKLGVNNDIQDDDMTKIYEKIKKKRESFYWGRTAIMWGVGFMVYIALAFIVYSQEAALPIPALANVTANHAFCEER